MNKNPRLKPLPLQKLERLIPRLNRQTINISEMQADLAKRSAGYNGEKRVDYHLQTLTQKHTILRDIYLKISDYNTIQIDTLILTPFCLIIIECKNYRNKITFDTEFQQLIHEDGETEQGYRYPITQVETQKQKLENWLCEQRYPPIPIHTIIAIATPSTIIQVDGNKQKVTRTVLHAEQLTKRIREIITIYTKKHERPIPTQEIHKALLNMKSEFDLNIMKQYGIMPNMIQPGVICPSCQKRGMNRQYANWKCPTCGAISRNAHHEALKTYQLLINPKITNHACRNFLNVKSHYTATRLMKSAGLTYIPEHRHWIIPNEH